MALRLSALAAAAAIVLAGCGSDPKVDTGQIRNVVDRFARAHDARACDLLSKHALINLYGGFKKNAGRARANCVRQSKHFRGEQITIQSVNVIDGDRVRVSAEGPGGAISYGISMRRYGAKWRIESISQAKLAG